MNPIVPAEASRMVTRTISGTPTGRKTGGGTSSNMEQDVKAKTPRKKPPTSAMEVDVDRINSPACESCRTGDRTCVNLGLPGQFSCKDCSERKARCSLSKRVKKEKGKANPRNDDEDVEMSATAATPRPKASGSKAVKPMVSIKPGRRGEYQGESTQEHDQLSLTVARSRNQKL